MRYMGEKGLCFRLMVFVLMIGLLSGCAGSAKFLEGKQGEATAVSLEVTGTTEIKDNDAAAATGTGAGGSQIASGSQSASDGQGKAPDQANAE